MKRERVKPGMTGWYDPGLLVQTGIRVAISTIFGQFADKREAIAAANAIEPQPFDTSYDYSAKSIGGEFWFDFMADTGDGWDSTVAMAQLVSAKTLRPAAADRDLPRGAAIILGGDQVYPTASKADYDDRFLGPFDAAFEALAPADREAMPDLYAIPGNHDWYDGLVSFLSIFCRRSIAVEGRIGIGREGRRVAGRQTRQTRSYFAIKLPGDWWLWGTDSQLSNYVDQPQIEYFNHVARYWMAPKSKLILCVGQPHWARVDVEDPGPEYESFSYLERLCGIATDDNDTLMGHELKLVLTGDSHHYSRYVEPPVQYVTCGGGGAFLHPTHQLRSKMFRFKWPRPGVALDDAQPAYDRSLEIADKAGTSEPAVYPDMATSRRLTWRNLGFSWLNRKFTGLVAAVYATLLWLLNFAAHGTPMGDLAGIRGDSFRSSLGKFGQLLGAAPWPSLAAILLFLALVAFADASTSARRWAKAGVHLAAHAIVFTAVATIGLELTADWWRGRWDSVGAIGSVVAVASVAAVVSATVFGLYLLINLQLWQRHANEAFSALRIKDYKSFLRLRIDEGGTLTLFPIGLASVMDGNAATADLQPHLIEPPVTIA